MGRARKLKVYGWTGYRRDCPPAPNGNRQTREIVATTSKKEAARLVDPERSWMRPPVSEIDETGNAAEIELATANPGVVFWCPIDESYRGAAQWRRA